MIETYTVRIAVRDMTPNQLGDLLDLMALDVNEVVEFAIDGPADEPLETLARAAEGGTR